jgi:hypothetical protein
MNRKKIDVHMISEAVGAIFEKTHDAVTSTHVRDHLGMKHSKTARDWLEKTWKEDLVDKYKRGHKGAVKYKFLWLPLGKDLPSKWKEIGFVRV